tara:strand:- start:5112 stop:5648 length:537 start_codon:yes stop_codon:yes gene_type:complete
MTSIAFQGIDNEAEFKLVQVIEASKEQDKKQMEAFESLSKQTGFDLHLLVQRAFQLKLIPFTPYSEMLLSHRFDGWRSDEVNFLIENPDLSRKELGRLIGRSPMAVNRKFYEFRLTKQSEPYDWSDRERAFLSEHLDSWKLSDLAHELRRTLIDVKHQLIEIGLRGQCFIEAPHIIAA